MDIKSTIKSVPGTLSLPTVRKGDYGYVYALQGRFKGKVLHYKKDRTDDRAIVYVTDFKKSDPYAVPRRNFRHLTPEEAVSFKKSEAAVRRAAESMVDEVMADGGVLVG